eukprot:5622497-Prymnesium_polylepis.1
MPTGHCVPWRGRAGSAWLGPGDRLVTGGTTGRGTRASRGAGGALLRETERDDVKTCTGFCLSALERVLLLAGALLYSGD